MKDTIKLTGAEIQSWHSRVDWAEGLIEQLPDTHEGRNSWLLNYGKKVEYTQLRRRKNIKWIEETESAETAGSPIEKKTISFNQLTDGVIIDTINKEVEEGYMKGLNYDRVILSEGIFNMTCIRNINTRFGEIEIQKGAKDTHKNFFVDSGHLYFKGQFPGLPSNTVLEMMKEKGVIKEIEFIFTTGFEKVYENKETTLHTCEYCDFFVQYENPYDKGRCRKFSDARVTKDTKKCGKFNATV